MNILAFETASGKCSVCITKNIQIMATEHLFENSMQAENLTPMIDKALAKADISMDDIDYISTTNGPGSFTGIRIGLAAALGLVNASKKTPIIVSSFEVINYRIREQYRNFDKAYCIIEAHRGECYLQIFDRPGDALSEGKLLSIEEVRELISADSSHKVIGGSGSIHFTDMDSNQTTILPRFPYPDARIICKLARNLALRENFSSSIEPLYIRKPDAKVAANISPGQSIKKII